MSNKILALFLAIFSTTLNAQETVFTFIEKVNTQLLAIEKGSYSVYYKYKSYFDADTSIGGGSVQYCKTQGGPGDSIARFTFWPTSTIPKGFDGVLFWTVNQDQKQIIQYNPAQKKGIKDYISHYNSERTHILSVPILTNKEYLPLNPADFEGWNIEPFQLNDTLFVALNKSSFSKNSQRLTPLDCDSMHITEQWLFYPDVFTPRRIRLIIDRGNNLTYFDEINYSPIARLPDSLELQDLENSLAHFLKQGYQFVEKTLSMAQPAQRLSIGDSIPDFTVRVETGDTLPLFTAFKQHYLVLDFWYRACAPCNLAMPGLNRTARVLTREDVAIVGINPIDKQYEALIKQYKQQYGYSFKIAFADKTVAEQLRIRAYPTLMVVDGQTRRVIRLAKGYGEHEEAELLRYLENLLK